MPGAVLNKDWPRWLYVGKIITRKKEHTTKKGEEKQQFQERRIVSFDYQAGVVLIEDEKRQTEWWNLSIVKKEWTGVDCIWSSVFPKALQTVEIKSSHDGLDENLVIFLHGRGDTFSSFMTLGKHMQLPQTGTFKNLLKEIQDKVIIILNYGVATMAIQAPLPLPMDLGYSWLTCLDADYQFIAPQTCHKQRMKR